MKRQAHTWHAESKEIGAYFLQTDKNVGKKIMKNKQLSQMYLILFAFEIRGLLPEYPENFLKPHHLLPFLELWLRYFSTDTHKQHMLAERQWQSLRIPQMLPTWYWSVNSSRQTTEKIVFYKIMIAFCWRSYIINHILLEWSTYYCPVKGSNQLIWMKILCWLLSVFFCEFSYSIIDTIQKRSMEINM